MTYYHIRNRNINHREMKDKKTSLLAIMSYVRMIQDQYLKEGKTIKATEVSFMCTDYKEYIGLALWELVDGGYLTYKDRDGSSLRIGHRSSTGIASPTYYFYLTDKAMGYAKHLRSGKRDKMME